ncbi:MAG: transglycosylase SLT domain-containing protein [Candidatus Binatia bacterium]
MIFLAWLLSGCVVAVPPQPATVYNEKPQQGIDMDLLRSLLEKYTDEEELFALYPLREPEKKEIAQVEEKKEIQKGLASAPEEPPTALQEAPGPTADDRLLDLWKKDIDRAMQNPPGQRKIEFSIPLVENNRVLYFVNFFSGRLRGFFERALARSGRYVPMMTTILREEGLPEELVYLSLIESGFSPYAYSKAKAMGPWQFIRGTGLRYGLKINGWVDERKDPIKSTRAAAAYLKDLHLQFGEWFLAAAAYNAGERKVEKAISRSRTNDFWHLSQKTHLKSETRNYVPKFIAATLIASTPEKYGFGDVIYEPPMEYDEVSIKKPLRLQTIAELASTTVAAIKELNPALLRNSTPPSENGFMLRVPAGRGETFSQAYELLPDSAAVKVITHTVRKGETLVTIAKKYRQQVSQLMELNNLKSRRIQVGQDLIIMPDGAPKKR